MIVMKFGGTSVGSAERIKASAEIIRSNAARSPIIVVSAVTKVTDMLIRLANEPETGFRSRIIEEIKNRHYSIIEELGIEKSAIENDLSELETLDKETPRNVKIENSAMDHFQSFGERMSSKIVAAYLNLKGLKAQPVNSWDAGLLTTSDFGGAEPLEESYENIRKSMLPIKQIPVVTGFIGKEKHGRITTLGRGGSDYTAAIFGNAVDADEIQIWTDVNGVMSSDPRIVKNARPVRQVSFKEAFELAYFGAKVLHPKTMFPAMKKNIPVKVLNSFNPDDEGTTIISNPVLSESRVKSIACKNDIIMINICSSRMLGSYGFLAKVFEVFRKYRKSVDVISTSEVTISLTVDTQENVELIAQELREIGNTEVSKNKSIVCVVGEGIKNTAGIAGKIFKALAESKINVEMISMGASSINMTFVVDCKDTENAVRALHREFFGD